MDESEQALNNKNNYSWYRVSSILWIVVIALQWVNFTEPLWFQETTTLVAVTLILVAAATALPLPAVWSWILKALLVIISWWVILVAYNVYVPEGPFFPDQLFGIFGYLTPYIWFSLAAWAGFELVFRFVQERLHILLMLGVILIAFTILDSFTPYKCWHNVAWTVFAGLGWLSTLHFRQFQIKYPQGWSTLRHQPIKVIANVTVIVACVILIGISVPSVSPLLTDPYTAWFKNKGDGEGGAGTRLVAADTEAITYIAPKDVVSGYSRDDTTLGEGFDFLYSPVMSVDSPIRSYWRGETRRTYTGKGWANLEQEPRDYDLYPGESTGDLMSNKYPKLKTQRVEQIITMESEQPYPVLFGAYTIRSIEILKEEDDDNPTPKLRWASEEAEVHFGESDAALLDSSFANIFPNRYKVVSEVPLIPLEEVRKLSFDDLGLGNPSPEYLQIPNSLPQRVKDLAVEVTAEGETPYEKMELLQTYLKQNFEYTNKPDLSRRKSPDFVDGFLFEIKQGYCDYYSTTMVMMARSLGIPARWVKGYAPGSLPVSDFIREQMIVTGGTYKVNNADAHSWAELYFGDYGWVTFEATPGFDSPTLYWNENEGQAMEGSQINAGERDGGVFDGFTDLSSSSLRIISVVSVIIVAIAAIYWLRVAIYHGIYRLRLGRSLTVSEKAVLEILRVVKRLSYRGFLRNDSETMGESFKRWKQNKPELSSILDPLLSHFERANYSLEPFTEGQFKEVRRLSQQLMKVTRKKVGKI